ncbi:hypothetical protein [Allostreptomyces psammosilenae]|uniref:Uncharacterized protein n=1 Tax=Allostreptomyces psammosilenae TaxID=1892865 RepID=A0A852ZZL9_9ACTN|nr:hypothetical protein [Allostreptomyces psammosilenae]NYI07277.1 hypothetical protein [Allostreptomyces psammosilenae]
MGRDNDKSTREVLMTHQLSRARRVSTLIAAGVLSVGLVAVGSTASAATSTPPPAPAAAVDSGSSLVIPSSAGFGFAVEGAFAENLVEISVLNQQASISRFPGAHSIVDDWVASMNDPREPLKRYVTIYVFDYMGNIVRGYELTYPRITKIVHGSGGAQRIEFTYQDQIIL